jgi:hypothetical protein
MLSAGYGLYKRILTKIAKITGEPLQVIIVEGLIREGENTVLNPCSANVGDKILPKVLA